MRPMLKTIVKRLHRFSPTAAVLLLGLAAAGCTQNGEAPDPDADNVPMAFTGQGVVPKGWEVTRTTSAYPVGGRFGVLGYYTGTGSFVTTTSGSLPNLMYNQMVENTASGCVYSPVQYWTPTHKYTFFAYSPYNSPGVTLSSPATKGNPSLTLTMTDKVSATSDLSLAPIVLNVTSAANPIAFTFSHVLCRVRFAAVFESSLDSVRLDRITFSGIRNTGAITSLNRTSYTGNPWSGVAGNVAFDILGTTPGDTRTAHYTSDPNGVVFDDLAAYLLPQGGSGLQPIVYEIAYTAFPVDGEPVSSVFTYSSTASNFLTYGKSYLYKLIFKDAGVNFTAMVDEWEDLTDNTINLHDIPFY